MAAKKKVFRIIGNIRTEDVLSVVQEISPYAFGEKTNRLLITPRKQDKGKPADKVKFQYIQIDFTDLQRARKCHYAVKHLLVKDSSDFLQLL